MLAALSLGTTLYAHVISPTQTVSPSHNARSNVLHRGARQSSIQRQRSVTSCCTSRSQRMPNGFLLKRMFSHVNSAVGWPLSPNKFAGDMKHRRLVHINPWSWTEYVADAQMSSSRDVKNSTVPAFGCSSETSTDTGSMSMQNTSTTITHMH